jgi:hypothetical protein
MSRRHRPGGHATPNGTRAGLLMQTAAIGPATIGSTFHRLWTSAGDEVSVSGRDAAESSPFEPVRCRLVRRYGR